MHPYKTLPEHGFWRQSVAQPSFGEVDPGVRPNFLISRQDRVATAGSCFAQHIARHLAASGFHYLVTETPHPLVSNCDVASYGYGVFTARHGNVYTPRQLIQLLQRAYGQFVPADDMWLRADGRLIDPFRPQSSRTALHRPANTKPIGDSILRLSGALSVLSTFSCSRLARPRRGFRVSTARPTRCAPA
jgi:hypothetical protein